MTGQKKTLDMMVSAAVGAMLVGRDEITLEQAERALPEHIRAARPTHKSIVRALVAAGWEARRAPGGHVSYAPPSEDPEEDEPGERGLGDNLSGEQLRQFIERIESIREDKKDLANAEKDAFTEAKGAGFDVKSMRTVLRLRGMEKHHRDEADTLVEMYRNAMGV